MDMRDQNGVLSQGLTRSKWCALRHARASAHAVSRWCWIACLPLVATAWAVEPAPYEVQFRGVPEWGLRGALRQSSDTYALRDRPPPTDLLLSRRAEQDLRALRAVLRAAGYYSAEPSAEVISSLPRRVVFHLNPGRRYRLGEVTVNAGAVALPKLARFGWTPGRSAAARPLLDAEEECLAYVRAQGYPFPRWTHRVYTPDPQRRLLHAELTLDPGPSAVWGDTSITGLVRVAERFLRNELALPPGAPFRPDQLTETRTRLIRLGLFSTISLAPSDRVTEDGRLPVSLTLRERRPRTLSAGLRYTTDEGSRARVEWEHRNLRGHAERLRLNAEGGERVKALEANAAVPQFGTPRQRLLLSARAAEESTDAYDARTILARAQLERDWRQVVWGRAGTAFRLSDVGQLDDTENYVFASFPVEVDWNTSRSALDPRNGFRLRAQAEPFYDLEAKDRGFLKTAATLNRYQRLNRDRTWLLAGRVSAGSISGVGARAVPADERFYAGGGSSVRGYAYQTVGPLVDGDPVGGRSLFETSGELRAQVSESMGFVLFLDGGAAFTATTPDFNEPLRWGAGFGLRYFTAVGPLRADVGFPLNRREAIDKPYQFYLSLGQSF